MTKPRGSFVLLISDRVFRAAEEIYPDLNQSLYLTLRSKKQRRKKEKKKQIKKPRQKQALKNFHPGTGWREGVQRHEEEGNREASRALQKHKANFPSFPHLPWLPGTKVREAKAWEAQWMLTGLPSISSKCDREAAGFNIFTGSRYLSLYRGELSTWLGKHLQITWHLALVLHNPETAIKWMKSEAKKCLTRKQLQARDNNSSQNVSNVAPILSGIARGKRPDRLQLKLCSLPQQDCTGVR